MQLLSARVINFKCIENSNEFKIDPVTCLVGKNESGKTALLQALYRLNPYIKEDGKFDKERDYPRRHLMNFEERHGDKNADVIITKWLLESSDLDVLAPIFGDTVIKKKEVIISKGYDNHLYWDFEINEMELINYLIRFLKLNEAEQSKIKDNNTIKTLKKYLTELGGNITENEKKLLQVIDENFKSEDPTETAIGILEKHLPKFLYFSQYNKMPGEVSIEKLIEKKNAKKLNDDEKIFLAFLGLVGTDLESIVKITKFESLIAQLEAASISISNKIFEYWTQNRYLKVQVRLDFGQSGDLPPFNSGRVMRIRVFNEHHQVSVNFDDRSTGFIWFFSFLVLFSQVKKIHGNNIVILLDEPGLSLHAKAQADLLRFIDERLRPDHQVIYTTHSPFMIDPENFIGTRTVEDMVLKDRSGNEKILGTKVGDEVLSTDRDTLFPLQSALGYEITQTLFVGKHTLLVEGPSDLIYLKIFQQELKMRCRETLDLRWTICPCGGIDKVGAFLTLFGANKLDIALLIDYSHGQKGKVEKFRRSKLLADGHVFTTDSYAEKEEADIEDIIGYETYCEMINICYNLKGTEQIPKKKIPSVRVLTDIDDHFNLNPAISSQFDHFEPASWLLENRSKIFNNLIKIEDALNRFEKLFHDLNSLLPKKE